MINKLKDILKDYNPDLIEDFLSISDTMNLSEDIKVEGLIYYALMDNKLTIEDIKQDYPNHLDTLECLIKLDHINYSQQEDEAENIRKMFFAITKDIRIIMLKIAFALARLRNLDEANDQSTFARSIFDLYAPLAARLGLSTIKTELENGAFRIVDQAQYDAIQEEVDSRFHKRQPIVNRLVTLVEKSMQELGIEGKVYGRKKHIYSIYKKLKDHSLDQIYDLIAVRAIVRTIPDCYALLGKIHSEVEPISKRFKDYIAIPKPNGYQSLHTSVKFEGFPVEIQIRTEDMHRFAEFGVAAHWMYKEKRTKQDTLDVRLAWLRQMLEDDNNTNLDSLASSLNEDIYNNEIFVQSPKGKVVYLPTGSTPIDFAYHIHSEIGNKCVGAKVNGKMVPTTYQLNNGDIVEIITNPQSKGPSRDWLKLCKTNEARNKINNFFKKNMKEENIKLGKSMLESAIKEKGYAVSKLTAKDYLEPILSSYNLELDELYANIGVNSISAKVITNKLVGNYQKQLKNEIKTTHTTLENHVTLMTPSDKQINIKGLNNILLGFAGCCHPMYGDDIIGFVSTGRGVIIHRNVCPNVSYFDSSRIIEAEWKHIETKPKKK